MTTFYVLPNTPNNKGRGFIFPSKKAMDAWKPNFAKFDDMFSTREEFEAACSAKEDKAYLEALENMEACNGCGSDHDPQDCMTGFNSITL